MRCYRHPDRETGVSCSECGRGICPDCMRFAPVGIRCPEHSGEAQGARRVVQGVQKRSARNPGLVTKTLIGINVGIYLLQLAGGASMNANSGWIFEHFALFIERIDSSGAVVGLAEGEWYRLLTAAFLHYGPIHLAMNMLALWWIGRPLEDWLGPVRYLLLYLVAGIAGSAGALIASPDAVTVGASGAIFGLFGAYYVVVRRLGGETRSIVTLLVINLVITFTIPIIDWRAHLGGLVVGALVAAAFSYAPRGPQRGRLQALACAAVSLVLVAAVVARTGALGG